jgi:hypothetical protein
MNNSNKEREILVIIQWEKEKKFLAMLELCHGEISLWPHLQSSCLNKAQPETLMEHTMQESTG